MPGGHSTLTAPDSTADNGHSRPSEAEEREEERRGVVKHHVAGGPTRRDAGIRRPAQSAC
jgi:hypothetical protein